MEKKVHILSEELIKPAGASHDLHRESFKFSALDQHAPPDPIPILLYYPADSAADDSSTSSSKYSRSLQLKGSLSKILADFYPFAGRIANATNTNIGRDMINCNDEGVLFMEAFAHNYKLQDDILIRKYCHDETLKVLAQFLPKSQLEDTTFVLRIQVTFFECGGMILGGWVSHKLADATSICTFINCWAAMSRSSGHYLTPDFTKGIEIFPPINPTAAEALSTSRVPQPPLPFMDLVKEQTSVSKIFVFDPVSLSNLKSKALSKDVPRPTRVEALTALIWKCVTASSSSSSYLSHAVNCRKRLVPSLPIETIGNFLAFFVTSKDDERDRDLPKLVAMLRKGLLKFPYNDNTTSINSQKGSSALTWDVARGPILENWNMFGDVLSRSSSSGDNDIELYHFTSWSGIPFYEADFGWGKPAWMSIMELHYQNTIVLLDSDDGGIQAWVCLEAKHMAQFEQNPDLLTFTAIH